MFLYETLCVRFCEVRSTSSGRINLIRFVQKLMLCSTWTKVHATTSFSQANVCSVEYLVTAKHFDDYKQRFIEAKFYSEPWVHQLFMSQVDDKTQFLWDLSIPSCKPWSRSAVYIDQRLLSFWESIEKIAFGALLLSWNLCNIDWDGT